MVYVDEIDVDREGIAEMILDENAIAQVPRKRWCFSQGSEVPLVPLAGGNRVFIRSTQDIIYIRKHNLK